MADEVKGADSAQAPAPAQPGTPAATAAPATDTSQKEIQRLQAELGIERKRREETQKAFHGSQAQLKAIQQNQTGYEESGNGNGTGGVSPELMQDMAQTYGFVKLALEAADVAQFAPQINEVLSDPDRAARYADPNPYNTYRAVYRDVKAAAREAESAAKDARIAELEKLAGDRLQTREAMKVQAVSSGTQAAEPQAGEMTVEAFRKMSAAEQRQYLTAAGIYRG